MILWNESMERELNALREQVREVRRRRAALEVLPGKTEELSAAMPGLEAAANRSRKRADRLGKGGLWALPQRLTGRQEQAATKAEQAAREAYLAHESARRALADAARELEFSQKRLAELEGCEARFQELLDRKEERLWSMGSVTSKLEALEVQRDRAAYQARVLKDALAGGKDAIPLLTKFAHLMDDLLHLDSLKLVQGLLADEKWGQAREALQTLLAPFNAYCAPDFPSPVSGELQAACFRWQGRALEFLDRPCPSDLYLRGPEVRTLMVQAENLRGHVRATFPQLEVAVEESADTAARTMERWEGFVCDTPALRK